MNYETQRIFTEVYDKNLWNSQETRSGSGSELANCSEIIKHIPELLKRNNIKSVLDCPCGTYNWQYKVEWGEYIGADIVPLMIANNILHEPYTHFMLLDLITDNLPKADMILVRDCFVHLSFEDSIKAIENIKRAGIKYLLATSFNIQYNKPFPTSFEWRKINMEIYPFNLKAIDSIREFEDKYLKLYQL